MGGSKLTSNKGETTTDGAVILPGSSIPQCETATAYEMQQRRHKHRARAVEGEGWAPPSTTHGIDTGNRLPSLPLPLNYVKKSRVLSRVLTVFQMQARASTKWFEILKSPSVRLTSHLLCVCVFRARSSCAILSSAWTSACWTRTPATTSTATTWSTTPSPLSETATGVTASVTSSATTRSSSWRSFRPTTSSVLALESEYTDIRTRTHTHTCFVRQTYNSSHLLCTWLVSLAFLLVLQVVARDFGSGQTLRGSGVNPLHGLRVLPSLTSSLPHRQRPVNILCPFSGTPVSDQLNPGFKLNLGFYIFIFSTRSVGFRWWLMILSLMLTFIPRMWALYYTSTICEERWQIKEQIKSTLQYNVKLALWFTLFLKKEWEFDGWFTLLTEKQDDRNKDTTNSAIHRQAVSLLTGIRQTCTQLFSSIRQAVYLLKYAGCRPSHRY